MEGKKVMSFVGATIAIIIIGLAVVFLVKNKADKSDSATQSASSQSSADGATTQDSSHDPAWIEGLAKTLSEKGIVMYGASWCTHCKNQKKEFGDAVKYIDYVECDASSPNANPDECKANGIEGYPTWIYNGQKYSGEQSLDKLAEIVGYGK